MRKVLLVTAVLVAAVIFFLLATLPPVPLAVDPTVDSELQRRTVAGAYHIHSTASDGSADKDAIAAAAARAGLAFIIVTDHGDGMRPPDPPAYLHGVLCLEGVEISTNDGHYVALDMKAAPYPLGGEAAAVVEDVRRLGGFGIAAHPDSPRAELAWRDWTAPIDGIEWLNADSEWRDESRSRLARVLFDYALRPAPALASILDRPVAALARWDSLAATRPVVALAAADAHGGIGRGVDEGGTRRAAFGIPSYEASFRTFSNRVILDAPLSGDAPADGRRVLDAIEHGRVFTVIDAIAGPGFIDFRGSGPGPKPEMGSVLRTAVGTMSVDVSMPAGAGLFLANNGREFEPPSNARAGHYSSGFEGMGGAVRFEVRVSGAPGTPPVPWLVSNPMYVLPPPPAVAATERETISIPISADATWHVEKDPDSRATLSADSTSVKLDYVLRSGARASQFVALAADLHMRAPQFSEVRLMASSSRPGRVSIQLRYPDSGGARWGASAFVDASPREIVIPVDRMRPLDHQTGNPPSPSSATALLVVIDLTHARPGDAGQLAISTVRFSR